MKLSCLFYVLILGMAPWVSYGASQDEGAFRPIFDGESLEGWDGDVRFWRVEAGSIVGETTEENRTEANTSLIWKGGALADFELKLDFKIRNGSSGIQYRSTRIPGKFDGVSGYQADISADARRTGSAYGEPYKGLLAGLGEKNVIGEKGSERELVALLGDRDEILSHVNHEGWNEYHIIAVGNQCIQKINGVITAEFSESAADRVREGLIALQLHHGEAMKVSFRDIRIRELESESKKQVLFLAGKKSHGYGSHEHRAGCHLLARSLNESNLDVVAQVEDEGAWPESWVGYDKPDAIVMYCDGLKRHLANEHQERIQSLVDSGVGVACLHFGVEVVPADLGEEFLDWIGGYFEIGWSVNPHWTASFDRFPEHPIANGVQPFEVRDEWYYHMRFRPEMKNVTPILSSLPPLSTLTSRSKNKDRGINDAVLEAVTAGREQVVAWASERADGGRGFGFTGGHFHKNWQQDDFRKTVLNALVWIAKGEVPEDGVPSRTPTDRDLELNQDYPKPHIEKQAN